MNASETCNEHEGLAKANSLNRIIAKAIDFIIVGALFEIIPKVGYFGGIAYLLICDGLFEGRSIGKRLIGLKVVVCETGQACSFRESILRNFPFAIGFLLMKIPVIGFIVALIILGFEGLLMIGDDKGIRIGDEIAKTQVVEEKLKAENKELKVSGTFNS